MSLDQPERSPARRGTTNGNARGSVTDLGPVAEPYHQDIHVRPVRLGNGTEIRLDTALDQGEPACRCYRCGRLLTVETVTVDRIVPGCRGGTYRRSNIRPACGPCNTVTGASTRRVMRGK